MKTVIIVQARMTSTRLPGKVLKQVLGKTLLEYQIERLQRVAKADSIVIATTTNDTDDPIVNLCHELRVPIYRGSEQDVLERYYGAAKEFEADTIVRVTSDCPLIDPTVIDHIVGEYQSAYPEFDYVSNTLERSYPRGMDTEVFSFRVLEEARGEAVAPPEREHVTSFLYHRPKRYMLKSVTYTRDCSEYRWTVDTREDFALIELMLTNLYPHNREFTLKDCLQLIARQPEWCNINASIEQKAYGQ